MGGSITGAAAVDTIVAAVFAIAAFDDSNVNKKIPSPVKAFTPRVGTSACLRYLSAISSFNVVDLMFS